MITFFEKNSVIRSNRVFFKSRVFKKKRVKKDIKEKICSWEEKKIVGGLKKSDKKVFTTSFQRMTFIFVKGYTEVISFQINFPQIIIIFFIFLVILWERTKSADWRCCHDCNFNVNIKKLFLLELEFISVFFDII